MIRTAKTENGLVRGLPAADPRITSFKGIPFAAPPTGGNRWRAPQPCASWEGVLDAYKFAPISVQDTPGIGEGIYNREWHVDPEIEMDEDCLYLNVWTNAISDADRLPVLVWFFGGGLQWGYPSEMEFDGERIARRDVVVVSVNYRLNCFGFMAHSELTAAQPDAPTNFGNLDQLAGLKWVISNIAAFGGDPGNITIAGQSAGGGSVLTQMASPLATGLFQKAVVMSGMMRNPYADNPFFRSKPLKEAEELGKQFLDFLGVGSIKEARQLDAFVIRNKYGEFAQGNPRMSPSADGVYNFGDPLQVLLRNPDRVVPTMAGNTAGEFLNYIAADNEDDFKAKADEIFGDKAGEFLSFAEALKKEGDGHYATVSGLEYTVKGFFEMVDKPGYYYRFDTDIPGWDDPGTFHSVDLWFFFETLAKCWRPFVGRHYDLARQMCDYYCNFIKNGDPNGEGLPEWGTWDKRSEMVFGRDGAEAGQPDESGFERFIKERIVSKLK